MKILLHELQKLAEEFVMTENFNLLESDRFKHLYIGLFNRNLYSILDSNDKYIENISPMKTINHLIIISGLFIRIYFIYSS